MLPRRLIAPACALALVTALYAPGPALEWRVPQLAPVRGHEYVVELAAPSGLTWGAAPDGLPIGRDIAVFEDARRLGPGRAELDDIATRGGGRFSQRGLAFHVSPSDDASPLTSGRAYRVLVPLAALPGLEDAIVAAWLALGWMAFAGQRLAFAAIALTAARLWRFAQVPLVEHPDTALYRLWSAGDPTTLLFWTGARGAGYPLFLKVVGGEGAVAWAQAVIASAAWLALALAVARRARPEVALALVLAFGAVPEVAQWDHVLLTESLSGSLTALLVALTILALEVPRPERLAALVAVSAGLVLVRDANAMVVGGLAAVAALAVAARRLPARWLAVAAACALMVAANGASVERGQRWLSPFDNVMKQRVLPDAAAAAWFRAHGMPEAPDVGWERTQGRATYARYLLEQPSALAAAVWQARGDLVSPRLSGYAADGYRSAVPAPLDALVYARSPFLLALLVGFALHRFLTSPRSPGQWLGAALMALAPAVAIAVVAADAIEVGRHALPADLLLRLGAWIIVLGA